jgi:hypothetical protein
MIQAFRAANDVLLGAVQGIADLIVRPGLINVDFADVRTVMSEMGMAMMGRAWRAATTVRGGGRSAIQQPAAGRRQPVGANGILVNITAGPDFTMREFDEVGRTVEQFASEDATVVIGTVLDPDMQDEVRVTVVATGLNRNAARQPVRQPEREVAQRPVKLVRNATTGLAEPRPKPGWAGTRWTTSTFLPSCAARPTDRPATLGRADSTRRARDLSKPCLSSRCCLDCQARGTPAQLNSVQRECCKNATTRRFCVVFGFPPQKSRDILRRLWLCSCSET